MRLALALLVLLASPSALAGGMTTKERIDSIVQGSRVLLGAKEDGGVEISGHDLDKYPISFAKTVGPAPEVRVSFHVHVRVWDDEKTRILWEEDLSLECTDRGADGRVDSCIVHSANGTRRTHDLQFAERRSATSDEIIAFLQTAYENALAEIERMIRNSAPVDKGPEGGRANAAADPANGRVQGILGATMALPFG